MLGIGLCPVDSSLRWRGGPADSAKDTSSGLGDVAGRLRIPATSHTALARGMEGKP